MRLIGVGMGPGDPELVTVKAARLLRDADRVFVPVLDLAEEGRAETTARAHLDHERVERLLFALNERHDAARRERHWDAAGRRVAEWLAEHGGTAVFATIGDPNLYSTFGYLAATVRTLLPAVTVETIPGITAMQALAAASGTPLTEGAEPLVLIPLASGAESLPAALDYAADGTVVAYKAGRHMAEVSKLAAEAGRFAGAVYGARLGMPGETVAPLTELAGEAPYLSTVLFPGRRERRGGKL